MLCFDKIFFNLKIIIFRYLLEYQANVSAVNNDGELAIDISESDEMEELLQKEIDKQGINCDESRNTEERLMLEDARSWLNAKVSFSFTLIVLEPLELLCLQKSAPPVSCLCVSTGAVSA